MTPRNRMIAAIWLLGLVMPALVHPIEAPCWMFLPAHFPALLAGLSLGPAAGVGAATATILGELLVAGPRGQLLTTIALEFIVYGLVSGICGRRATGLKQTYLALLVALVSGRIAYSAVSLIFDSAQDRWDLFLSVTWESWPGIALQLALLPWIALRLRGGIENRGVTPVGYQSGGMSRNR